MYDWRKKKKTEEVCDGRIGRILKPDEFSLICDRNLIPVGTQTHKLNPLSLSERHCQTFDDSHIYNFERFCSGLNASDISAESQAPLKTQR